MIHVFVGPTLPVEEARRELDATYCPPAARGDVYRAVEKGARVIGIVDGYFDTTPSVWHREILWAIAEGVHVFGAASMGALRAAELDVFGMEGVGYVYQAFSAGLLQDDDDVAVTHATAEYGYRQASEAMVNIRATLAGAARQGVIGDDTARLLERCTKGLFYADRSYERLCRTGGESGAPAKEIDALRRWLPSGRIDVKRADAMQMLEVIRKRTVTAPAPKQVGYRFEHTLTWESLLRHCAASDAK